MGRGLPPQGSKTSPHPIPSVPALDSPNRSALIPAVPRSTTPTKRRRERHGDLDASVPEHDTGPPATRFGPDAPRHDNPPAHPAPRSGERIGRDPRLPA